MAQGMLMQMGDPHVAYATSGVAVRELVRQGGTGKLLTLIRAVGAGTSFEEALQEHYGKSVSKLDDEVKSALSRR
jgi:Arc/MetJ family transcription regulator